jgi:hypothetical protein
MATRKSAKSSKKTKASKLPHAGGDLVTAAEYARRVGISPPRMTKFFHEGMPFVNGKDAEGRRDCKLVDVHAADLWRMANTDIRIDADGRLRGLESGARAPAPVPAGALAGTGVPSPAAEQATPSPVSGESPASPKPPAEELTGSQLAAARIAEAKAAGVEADTDYKRQRLAAAQGLLVDRKAAIGAHQAFVQKVGVSIDRMPQNYASKIAARLGVSEHEAFKALKEVVAQQMREDLARDARSHADAARRRGG